MIFRILGIVVSFVIGWILGTAYYKAKIKDREIELTEEESKFIDNRPIS